MHPTIERVQEVVAKGDEAAVAELLAEDVTFLPPTYWKTWTGRAPVAAVLGHVGQIFQDFRYRRVMGDGNDWALEFQCKVGDLESVVVHEMKLNDAGLIQTFEVVMRPYKTVGALREAINARVMTDARFLEFRHALT